MAHLPVGELARHAILIFFFLHPFFMANTRMTRQKAFELQAADARRRWERTRQRESASQAYYAAPPRETANTLGPQEDVVESRRRRRNRVVMTAPRASTKSILTENILLLVLLVASIYGLYLLSIHILNQS